jgi:ammonium transporter Rh
MFVDIHLMIFFGIGYLMSFLSRYAWSAVGVTFFMASIVFQLSTITNAVGRAITPGESGPRHAASLQDFILADFTSATVLISFGAVVGRMSPMQTVAMVVVECVVVAVNDCIGRALVIADMGGGIGVHIFGAYFGLALARALGPRPRDGNGVEPQMSHPNAIFTMIGTLFLLVSWPSFNAALAPEGATQHRVILNTVVALVASTTVAFGFSRVVRGGKRFDMEDVQNATLAGGVSMGAVCDFPLGFWGAALLGSVAALISVTGYSRVAARLREWGLQDTAGIHNLHAMPGMLSGIASVIAMAVATKEQWGGRNPDFLPEGRSFGQQAGVQMAAILIALALAISSGTLTGYLLRHPFFDPVGTPAIHYFQDESLWHMEALDTNAPDKPHAPSASSSTHDTTDHDGLLLPGAANAVAAPSPAGTGSGIVPTGPVTTNEANTPATDASSRQLLHLDHDIEMA